MHGPSPRPPQSCPLPRTTTPSPSDGRYSLVFSIVSLSSVIGCVVSPEPTYLCFEDVMPRYKYCIVPQCQNTTHSTPNKLFFSVPTGEKRKEWCLVTGRVPGKHKTLSPTCNRFICEDHFNLQEDMENYMMWRTVGVGKLKLKKGVLPHKFECRNQHCVAKKRDTTSDRARRTDSEIHHTTVITDIKDEYNKEQKCERIYICKGDDIETQQTLEIAIKKEVTNIIIKEEMEEDEMETYVFNVHYDSDTGVEYLIDLPKKVK